MSTKSPPAAFVQPSPGDSSSGTFTGHQAGSGGSDFTSGAVAVRFSGPDPINAAPLLAGCTGIARVGICIRCERLYIGGPQIAPLAKRESGLYRCIEFVSNGQRLADKKESK